MGKVFKVQHIAITNEEANQFCSKHKDTGVIATDQSGLIYIADLCEMTISSDLLPD
jgi:hypothetical protein